MHGPWITLCAGINADSLTTHFETPPAHSYGRASACMCGSNMPAALCSHMPSDF